MESNWLVRKSTTQVLCEKVERLESDLATAEQDSRQKQARIERLENAVRELREALRKVLCTHDYHTDDGMEASDQASFTLKNTEDT